jgi:vancomycin permeability regulator SanA
MARRRGSPWPTILLGVWLVGVYALTIVLYGVTSRARPADVAIVFGSLVRDGQPSPRLAARLEAGRKLYEDRLARVIVVSGATGKEGYDESAVMRDWLLAHGVPDSSVVRDSLGKNSHRTGVNVAALMKSRGYKNATVVTQHYHIARATLACRQQGIDVTGAAVARRYEWRDLYSLAREMAALPVYAVRHAAKR